MVEYAQGGAVGDDEDYEVVLDMLGFPIITHKTPTRGSYDYPVEVTVVNADGDIVREIREEQERRDRDESERQARERLSRMQGARELKKQVYDAITRELQTSIKSKVGFEEPYNKDAFMVETAYGRGLERARQLLVLIEEEYQYSVDNPKT
jgi:hypothetical protein